MNRILATSMMAVMAMAPAVSVFAFDIVSVSNNNYAEVGNTIYVGASTGDNSSDGGYAGGAGDGGSVISSDDDNMGGNGGNAGNGGNGGGVLTGPATAWATITNDVNYNETHVDDCGCLHLHDDDHDHDLDITTVDNVNTAYVGNYAGVGADTGDNSTDGGSTGGGAGDGGHVIDSDDDNTGGNGGNAGNGGHGGQVRTGSSDAGADVINRVNTNITRVRN